MELGEIRGLPTPAAPWAPQRSSARWKALHNAVWLPKSVGDDRQLTTKSLASQLLVMTIATGEIREFREFASLWDHLAATSMGTGRGTGHRSKTPGAAEQTVCGERRYPDGRVLDAARDADRQSTLRYGRGNRALSGLIRGTNTAT